MRSTALESNYALRIAETTTTSLKYSGVISILFGAGPRGPC